MKIHHFGCLVGDIDRSLAALQTLGYEVESRNRNDTRGVDICFVRNGSCRIELVCPFREDSDVSGLLKKHRNMIYHVCYISEDIQKDIKKLRGGGVRADLKNQQSPFHRRCGCGIFAQQFCRDDRAGGAWA